MGNYQQIQNKISTWLHLLAGGLLLLVFSGPPCHAGQKPELTIYAVIGYADKVARLFRQKSGIKARVVRLNGNGAVYERIRLERENPKGDIWLGGSIGAHAQAVYEGLTTPYQPADITNLDPRFRDPLGDFRVIGLYLGVQGIVVNTAYLKKNKLAEPISWQCLLDPSYKGTIGMKSPLVSGTAYTTLSALVQLMGEDAAFFYLKGLNNNLSPYKNSHTRRVNHGQLGIAITFAHEAMEEMNRNSGHHLKVIYPQEGTGYEIGGISLIKNGPNSKTARAFIDFILSETAQALFTRSNHQLPVHIKAQKYSASALALDTVKLIQSDPSWSGKHRRRLIDRYRKEVLTP